jgi:hypothetical protein
MLAQVVVPVPGGGASAWIPSTLRRVTSFGLSFGAAKTDIVQLCGSNDNTVAVTNALAIANLRGFAGPSNQPNAGLNGQALGAWLYYAVIRTGGATGGLNLILAGNT